MSSLIEPPHPLVSLSPVDDFRFLSASLSLLFLRFLVLFHRPTTREIQLYTQFQRKHVALQQTRSTKKKQQQQQQIKIVYCSPPLPASFHRHYRNLITLFATPNVISTKKKFINQALFFYSLNNFFVSFIIIIIIIICLGDCDLAKLCVNFGENVRSYRRHYLSNAIFMRFIAARLRNASNAVHAA